MSFIRIIPKAQTSQNPRSKIEIHNSANLPILYLSWQNIRLFFIWIYLINYYTKINMFSFCHDGGKKLSNLSLIYLGRECFSLNGKCIVFFSCLASFLKWFTCLFCRKDRFKIYQVKSCAPHKIEYNTHWPWELLVKSSFSWKRCPKSLLKEIWSLIAGSFT